MNIPAAGTTPVAFETIVDAVHEELAGIVKTDRTTTRIYTRAVLDAIREALATGHPVVIDQVGMIYDGGRAYLPVTDTAWRQHD